MLVTLGGLFKIFHWPTAGIQLALGFFILCVIFMPMAFRSSYKAENNKKMKFLYILVFVILFLDFAGVLFKLMHWPGAGFAIPINISLIFLVLLPAYVLYNRNEKEINYNNFLAVMFFFAYFAAVSALLSVNIRKEIIDVAVNSSTKIDSQSELITKYNGYLMAGQKDTVANNQVSEDSQPSSEKIIAYIERLKLQLAIEAGDYNMPANTTSMDYNSIERKDNWLDKRLVNEDAPVLKEMIEKYRESLFQTIKDEKIKEQIGQLLSTTDNYHKGWEVEHFQGRNLILALQELNVVKYKVLTASNIILLSK